MRWIFHVGFPKCASTSIQMSLAKSKSVHYSGKKQGTFSGTNGLYVVRQILAASSKNTLDHEVVRNWKYEVEQIARIAGHDTIVVSDELFTSLNKQIAPVDNFEALHSVFGDALELRFVIRNHWSLLKSNYRQKIKVGMPFDFAHFCLLCLYNKHSMLLRNVNFEKNFSSVQRAGIPYRIFLFERIVSQPAYFRELITSFGITDDLGDLKGHNTSPDDVGLEYIRQENLKRSYSTLGSFALTHNFESIHEIDRKGLETLAKELCISSPTLSLYIEAAKQAIKARQDRIRNPQSMGEPIDWSLPDNLRDELENHFRESCLNLNTYVGDDCASYGYAVRN